MEARGTAVGFVDKSENETVEIAPVEAPAIEVMWDNVPVTVLVPDISAVTELSLEGTVVVRARP